MAEMADTNKKQPLSLNQRHRLFSASHSKHTKPFTSSSSSFSLHDQVPSFDFDSFDSPSPPPPPPPPPPFEPHFNLDCSPEQNDDVSEYERDSPSLSAEEVSSEESSDSKFHEDASAGNGAVSPISPLAGFDSSSPSHDEQLEVNIGGSSAGKIESPKLYDLARGDSSVASLEKLNEQGEATLEEALSENEQLDEQGEATSEEGLSENEQLSEQGEATSEEALSENEQLNQQAEATADSPFSSVPCADSLPAVQMEPSKDDVAGKSGSDTLRKPYISVASNSNSSITGILGGGDKQNKVKIAGRRRLCKISVSDDEDNGELGKTSEEQEPKAPNFTDFDSPPQVRNAVEKDCCAAGNEIRDILTDLSSRLEILSIEKRRPPRKVDLAQDSEDASRNEENTGKKKDEIPEYINAVPTFSLSSGSSSDSTMESGIGDAAGNMYQRDIDWRHQFEANNKTKKTAERLKKGESKNSTVNFGPVYNFSRSKPLGLEEDNESGIGDATGNIFQRDSNWRHQFEANGFSESLNKTKKTAERLKKGESKNSTVNFGPVHNFSRSKPLGLEEDNEDDCVILSGKSVAKQKPRKGGKSLQNSNYFDEVQTLDDCGEALFTETKDLFTLSDPKSSYRLPAGIAKMLYPHQRDGLKWLWSLHVQGKGGILGDDMGLGKTMQICGFLTGLFHSNLIKRALIVAPKTLLPHWIKELSVVGLSYLTKEYFGTCAKARQYELQYVLQDKGILLTTYDILRNNAKALSGDDSCEDDIVWDYMILDEGHLIKNPGTQRAKSLLEIPCGHRIIISGTPLQNNLKELWALFNFSCPGLLGDKKWFKEKYENYILRANNKDASDREKRIGSTVAKELRERIQPYFLRRLKNEVFLDSNATGDSKLSKKNEIIVWLRLTSCQRHIYEAFLNSEIVVSAFDGSPLAALTILKKICDHPLLLTKRAAEDVLEGMESMLNEEDRCEAENLAMYIADVAERFDIRGKHEVSCKISFIMSLLDNLIPEGHNVLIFSQTRKMLNLIQEALSFSGYRFMRIDGTTKASDRVKIVNDFQESRGAPIFLLTSQVGGLGLTLTNADRVIVVDPAWNPSTDNQSVDRAYRIGQTKDVIVYRLMTSGTVEEKIYRKQVYKGGLFKTATENKEQIRYFSQQDLRDIFRLPKDGFDVSVTQRQLQEEHGQQHLDEAVKSHIKFLENLGIAGVSNHSLLFSKTAPVPVAEEEDELTRVRGSTFMAHPSSSYSLERNVDGAAYAFKPKDMKLQQKTTSPSARDEPTEAEITERINRLSQIYSNKVTVSKLPDKGEKIRNQIDDLKLDLQRIRMSKTAAGDEVIDLENMSDEFQRVLNV